VLGWQRGLAEEMRLDLADLMMAAASSDRLHGRRTKDGRRRWCSAPANCAARRQRTAGRARAWGRVHALYRGAARSCPRRACPRQEAAAACPPWTTATYGLPRAKMGPARAVGWAGADLGRVFGLGPDR
jgi:hypothetical protein